MKQDHAIESLKDQLMRACNTVPERVRNGSIQTTRQWLDARQAAVKLVKKPGVTAHELLGALNTVKG